MIRLSTVFRVILCHARLWLKPNGRIRPYKLLLQVTNDCNSRCISCHIWKINKTNPELKKSELTLEDCERIFQGFGKDLVWLSLSGGEVSLRTDLEEIVSLASKNCPSLRIITFTTNGIEVERIIKIARFIKNHKIDFFVVISLDGDKSLHDSLRGIKGNYESAQQCYRILKSEGITCYYGLTLGERNAQYVKDKYKDIAHDVKAVSLEHSGGIYQAENDLAGSTAIQALDSILKNYSIQSMSEIIEWLYLKLGHYFLRHARNKIPVPCEVLSTSLHIMPNGDVHPCMFLPALSNVKTSSLSATLSSSKARELREKIRREECPRCWMNCYAPHSIMHHPIKSIWRMR